ncbi:hypothetical protein M2275_001227 [Rhodococcus opacus]|nr:hypothetical protein [Rhodococcus opacus]
MLCALLRAAHRLSGHRPRQEGRRPAPSLPAPDVPSAVVLGHPAPRSVRFGRRQGVLAAFGEHRAVLADAFGVRFAPRPVATTLPLRREEQRRLDVPARPQDAPISTITVAGQSGPRRIFTAGSRHSARRTSGCTSHRIGVTHLTHGYLCGGPVTAVTPFANNILHNQSGRSLHGQVPREVSLRLRELAAEDIRVLLSPPALSADTPAPPALRNSHVPDPPGSKRLLLVTRRGTTPGRNSGEFLRRATPSVLVR